MKKISDVKKLTMLFRRENVKWIILAILLLIPFVSYCYGDTKSIIHFQINFADALFSGKIGDFYDICYERAFIYKELNLGGEHFATYDIVMHALLGIWGIPLYVWCMLKGVQEVLWNTSCMLYGKAIYIPALILSAYLVYKICRELKIDKKRSEWASYLFCSSLLVFTNVCIIGQSDILAIPFTLAGILYYIKNDNKKFLLFFMFAITFKMYAFFIFVPLLLLKEKRIVRIIGSMIMVYSLSFLANLPYDLKETPAMLEKAQFNQNMFNMLLMQGVPLLGAKVPLLVVALGLLCIYCYLKTECSEDDTYNPTIYIALLSMGIVFLSFPSTPYWYLHLCPYMVIVMVYYADRCKHIMLFETLGIVALTFRNYIHFHWCYDLKNANNMLMQKVVGSIKEFRLTFEQIVFGFGEYEGILNAIFVVSLIAVMWLSKQKKMVLSKGDNDELAKCVYIRLVVNVAVAYIPILVYMMNMIAV